MLKKKRKIYVSVECVSAYLYDDTKPFVAKSGHDFKSF